MAPHLAIVVLNWQQPQLTLKCLDSLFKAQSSDYRLSIILVDNGSTDQSQAIFTKIYGNHPQVHLLFNPVNQGYVEGNNLGLKKALALKADYVIVLNNDTQVKSDFIQPLLAFSRAHSDRYLLGPKIYFAPGYEYHHNYQKKDQGKVIWSLGGIIDWANLYGSNYRIDQVDNHLFSKPVTQLDFISGCCLFMPRRLLKTVGYFDSKYFLYLEDADFCQRAKSLGFKLAVVPQSVIWHYNSGSSGANSNLHHYFLSRNRLLFGYRWAPLVTKFHLFLQSLTYLISPPSVWHKRAIIDYYLGNLSQGSWSNR